MKSKDSDGIIVSVNGLDIKTNVFYRVLHKQDSNKEDSYPQEGATKFPSEGIGEVFQCRFLKGFGAFDKGVWDTGFYAESPCYANMDSKEVKSIVSSLKENIVDPYERKYGKGSLSHENNTFWSEALFNIQEGQILDMSDVEQRLTLYMAMRNFKLTPVDKVNDLRFKGSFYCVQDETKVRNRNIDKMANEMKVVGLFTTYSKTNVNLLKAIMNYSGFTAFSFDADEMTRLGMFGNWIRGNENNVSKFIEAVELADNKSTTDILFIYQKLPLAVKRKIIDREGGIYFYKGETLGGDLRTTARILNSKEEFESLKNEVLELE